jgi:hypothetical protein
MPILERDNDNQMTKEIFGIILMPVSMSATHALSSIAPGSMTRAALGGHRGCSVRCQVMERTNRISWMGLQFGRSKTIKTQTSLNSP